jgi:ferredoxin
LIVLVVLFALLILLTVLFALPVGKVDLSHRDPSFQVDERETIFTRTRLVPGTEQYTSYYRDHPEHQAPDDAARSQPGLLSKDAKHTDPLQGAAAEGSFFLTEGLREAVDGPLALEKIQADPATFTSAVKHLAAYYGALNVGITRLKPAQIYSHIGRGIGQYGAPVELSHNFGIAFTVEMDFYMTGAAPYPPLTMESGRQYVESARVAVQLAAFIRELGYPARAHIDGNYRVIAPLVARDAGLGEIGRMGLLMTPRQGPRVRIGVVSTDLPLIPDVFEPDGSVVDFCRICKKCAENCPSQSIPHQERSFEGGLSRWKINSETCYHYWTVVGTDCGRCIAVCPYSHPDNWIHNLVRWGITRSGSFRRAALFLDDFFYGKKPISKYQPILPQIPY